MISKTNYQYLSQQVIDSDLIEPGTGRLENYEQSWNLLNTVISATVGFITAVAGIWFLYLIITGAIAVMTAGGNKGQIEEARGKIFTAIVGLIIVVAGIFIVDLLGTFLGLRIRNPAEVIQELWGSTTMPTI
jgi:hypothetical protein